LRGATWRFIVQWLEEATDPELAAAGLDRQTAAAGDMDALGESASRLLVLSGAWREPSLMTGTVIMLDMEYLIGREGAAHLASASSVVDLHELGGPKRRRMRRQRLLSRLLAGTEVDQLV
jgi:hypothetical protein